MLLSQTKRLGVLTYPCSLVICATNILTISRLLESVRLFVRAYSLRILSPPGLLLRMFSIFEIKVRFFTFLCNQGTNSVMMLRLNFFFF